MGERCVRIGSAGKMFSLTGWKVGWVAGPRPLVEVVTKAHQFITFTTPTALQLGVAYGIEHAIDFTLNLTQEAAGQARQARRRHREARFRRPALRRHLLPHRRHQRPDQRARPRLLRAPGQGGGVALIPLSVFFDDAKPDHMVRFAFCKKHDVIDEALARLGAYFK